MILTARVEREGDADTCRVVINHDGRVVMEGESYTVASRVAEALVRDEGNTELQEVADAIKRSYQP